MTRPVNAPVEQMARTKMGEKLKMKRAEEKKKRAFKGWSRKVTINRDISKRQKNNDGLIPRNRVKRLVREIGASVNGGKPVRWQSKALSLLHLALEEHCCNVLQDANVITTVSGKQIVRVKHLRAAQLIKAPRGM